MNGDIIDGIAILDLPRDAGGERLLCHCRRANGQKPILISLPVRPRGTPDDARGAWQYDIDGDTIHVTPSVKVSWKERVEGEDDVAKWPDVERFHNTGDWRVKFERTSSEHPGGYELFCLRNGRDFV